MSDCPTEADLALFIHESLPRARRAEIERHSNTCAACQEVLARLSDPGSLESKLRGAGARRPEAHETARPHNVRTAVSPALRTAPPPAPASLGRWRRAALVAAVAAAVALGVKVVWQSAGLRDAAAAAERADRRAAAVTELADARAALARGLAALDDGDNSGADDVARAAAVARAVAGDDRLDADLKNAGAALLDETRAGERWQARPPAPAHPDYRPRLAVQTRDGSHLLTVASDPRVVVWDAKGEPRAACVLKEKADGQFESLAVSSDGLYVAAGGTDGRVWVWTLPEKGEVTPTALPVDVGGGRPVWVLAFTSFEIKTNMHDLWAAEPDGKLRDWRPVTGKDVRQTVGLPPTGLDRGPGPGPRVGPVRRGRPVVAAGADPTGRVAFTADPDGTFRYWDVPTRTPLGPPTDKLVTPPR